MGNENDTSLTGIMVAKSLAPHLAQVISWMAASVARVVGANQQSDVFFKERMENPSH